MPKPVEFSTVTTNLGRKVDEPATITLSLSQWNLVFCALFDAQEAMAGRGAPQSAIDYRVLRRLIEDQDGLSSRVRRAFAEDFPSLREEQAKTDAVFASKIEPEPRPSLHGPAYDADIAAAAHIETPTERANRLAGEKADRETLTF